MESKLFAGEEKLGVMNVGPGEQLKHVSVAYSYGNRGS
jgi:hypothetical protein